jgi:hypothetical protein
MRREFAKGNFFPRKVVGKLDTASIKDKLINQNTRMPFGLLAKENPEHPDEIFRLSYVVRSSFSNVQDIPFEKSDGTWSTVRGKIPHFTWDTSAVCITPEIVAIDHCPYPVAYDALSYILGVELETIPITPLLLRSILESKLPITSIGWLHHGCSTKISAKPGDRLNEAFTKQPKTNKLPAEELLENVANFYVQLDKKNKEDTAATISIIGNGKLQGYNNFQSHMPYVVKTLHDIAEAQE